MGKIVNDVCRYFRTVQIEAGRRWLEFDELINTVGKCRTVQVTWRQRPSSLPMVHTLQAVNLIRFAIAISRHKQRSYTGRHYIDRRIVFTL